MTHITQLSDEACQGPRWNNTAEYPSLDSPEFQNDLQALRGLMADARGLIPALSTLIPQAAELGATHHDALETSVRLFILDEKAATLSKNLRTFVVCELSVDGTQTPARAHLAELERLAAEQAEVMQPMQQLLTMASDAFIDVLCERPEAGPFAFGIRTGRWWKPHLLSLAEETLVTRLELNGPLAFANMYDNIQSTLEATIATPDGPRVMGVARANGLLQHEDEEIRKRAYEGLTEAWKSQRESCAAVLNGLSGWRTDLHARRSHTEPLHFLDVPLHGSRIERATLDAMMTSVDAHRELGRKALRLRARALQKPTMGPWDLFAPAPRLPGSGSTRHTFDEGIAMVREAFSSVHPDMGEFVALMQRNQWIEGSLGDRKRPGAYCDDFPKSRTPRVYMTYKGTKDDIGTLAHELGHAFHSWVMRDLPLPETRYPMTLAETASIFAETLLSDHLCAHSRDPGDLLSVMWNDISNVDSLLLNIPARFEFERRFYEARSQRLFGPDDLSGLMREAWEKYYGPSLSEMNDMFWASKLHFHLADISFYNFPYTFGYLFSLGIYAKRAELGKRFHESYVALLRDTGRMTAEDLARKHLGVDLRKPDFWNQSMNIVASKLSTFEALLADCCL